MAKKTNPRSATDVDAYIGERIRQARIEKGFSQSDLGEAIGVSFQQVQKIERGMNRIAASRCVAMARAFEKPISFFMPGGDNGDAHKHDPSMSKFLTTREGQEVATKFFKLTPTQRATVVDMITHLARDR